MKLIELTVRGTVESDKEQLQELNADEAQKCADSTSVARALVNALREQGVNVQTATLTFAPRSGSHDAPVVTDLTAEVQGAGDKLQVEEPATTDTASS